MKLAYFLAFSILFAVDKPLKRAKIAVFSILKLAYHTFFLLVLQCINNIYIYSKETVC